jgi:hypothetical protein
MKKRRDDTPDWRVLLLLTLLALNPLTITPPAPVFIHAGQVIVQPPPEETRPAMALILDAGPAPTLGGKV